MRKTFDQRFIFDGCVVKIFVEASKVADIEIPLVFFCSILQFPRFSISYQAFLSYAKWLVAVPCCINHLPFVKQTWAWKSTWMLDCLRSPSAARMGLGLRYEVSCQF